MKRTFLFALLALTAFGVYRAVIGSCPTGFERFSLFENGEERAAARDGWQGGWRFPPAEDPRFASGGFKYDMYDRFLECGHAREKYPAAINVVRFSINSSFQFVPTAPDARTSRQPLRWHAMPINQYSPADPVIPQYLGQYSPGASQSWSDRGGNVGQPLGRKHLIASLGIGWLKGEPLDEKHILGVWQGGWLFRSVKDGYYVWIG